ncbi:histone chaperone domain CHZ-domain-containing protein [Xylariomycetidae sp. FL0641]|nr:histone chaperone domain CHZ-domain-containing protein [Xylariomycetidae sp. FL0641]
MSSGDTTIPKDPAAQGAAEPVESKGKGKAVAAEEPMDQSMEEDDEDSGDDEEAAGDEEAEDGLDEIDTNNIVEGGRRTRGRVIDWAKAAEENPAEDDDDDEDEEDFEPEKEDDKMDED